MRWSPLLTLLATLLVPAGSASADKPRPVPSWVTPLMVPAPSENAELDTETLLIDQQESVEARQSIRYQHIAYRIRSTAGVQSSSELSVARASDEVVSWHFVRLHRDGQTRELLPNLRVKVIQPEDQLSAGIYDGARRELVILEDVRVGDVIEYGISIRSSTAVLDGRYVARHWLARSFPVGKFYLSVVWPGNRQLRVRGFDAEVERPSENALRYERENVPAYRVATREPAWYEATPRVELSEFTGWDDVVAWALPHYAQKPGPEIEALAKRLGEGHSLEEAASAVTRFVQDEVRYLGLEEGERAMVPHAPGQVLARRFGDCKDKSLLLVSLLRALGIKAEPALVSSRWERGVADMLPSTLAFNHVVTHATLEGVDLWIDATRSNQRGSIKTFSGLPYGRALLIREGENQLCKVPHRLLSTSPQVLVREVFTLPADGSPRLDVETTYTGDDADGMRDKLANSEITEVSKDYRDFYSKHYGPLSVRVPLEVQDDVQANRLIVREHYELSSFWHDEEQTVTAWLLLDSLPVPEASREARPFAIRHPVHVRHVIELDYAQGWVTKPAQERIDTDSFSYEYRSHHDGNREIIEHELRSKTDHVGTEGLPAYVEAVERARKRTDSHYVSAAGAAAAPAEAETWPLLTIPLALCLGMIAFGARAYRRGARRRTFERKKRFARGEAPESAIRLQELIHARDDLLSVRCCNLRVFGSGVPQPQSILYGGAPMSVYRGACASCKRSHARYFST